MKRQLSHFGEGLRARSAALGGKVVFPESSDSRILEATDFLLQTESVEEVFLLGDRARVLEESQALGLGLSRQGSRLLFVNEVWPDLQKKTADFLERRFSARRKPVDEKALVGLSKDPLFQAACFLASGLADAAVAGVSRTSASVIRAALSGAALHQEEKPLLSGAFLLTREDSSCKRAFLFADCAVTVEPTATQLARIAGDSVKTWSSLSHQLEGAEPVVAFVSFSTQGSSEHPNALKMREAYEIFRRDSPAVLADGELQLDAAIDAQVCLKKAPQSSLAGQANILIFPNLDAGNISYKLAQRLARFEALGPILQGLKKPYNDLSRGASVAEIIQTTYISLIRAQGESV